MDRKNFSYDILTINSMNELQFQHLRVQISKEIERQIDEKFVELNKQLEQSRKTYEQDWKSQQKKQLKAEARINKHANQVEKYLAGFNKLLRRIK